jgi:SSS family solute:Na+ symporter
MASSGNVVSDLFAKSELLKKNKVNNIRLSQITTFVIGAFALLLAAKMTNVLELMLYSYAFMVSGLFIPIVGALFFKSRNSTAAFVSMILGGGLTISLIIADISLPLDLDPNVFGISASALSFFTLNYLLTPKQFQSNGN